MNDFTKEELIIILGAFEWIDGDPAYREPGGWDKPLQTKIQSMIDNYCEHEDICKGNHMYVIDKCASCGKKINDNQ